jgi:hypothetical protein
MERVFQVVAMSHVAGIVVGWVAKFPPHRVQDLRGLVDPVFSRDGHLGNMCCVRWEGSREAHTRSVGLRIR